MRRRAGSGRHRAAATLTAAALTAVVLTAASLTGCTTRVSGTGSPASGTTAAVACPDSYAAPDPRRPTVALTFDLSADHHTVTGTEAVAFTPDADITELVFRLTANTAPTVRAGNGITVTSATADHGAAAATYQQAGAAAGTQGGLLVIPFASRVRAGTTVHASLAFTLTLGDGSFDRFGRSQDFAWFGSAQPLLAWERGYGWHTEPMIQFPAESATSEAARTDLTVTAPAADTVLMSGDPTDPVTVAPDRRRWHSTIDSARDVSVAAGPFAVHDETVAGARLRVGAPTQAGLAGVLSDVRFALSGLTTRFGPFPFPSLSVAVLPAQGGGIEYPSSTLLFGPTRLVTVHEIAHQWFYAMVGDSQAEHAWLDEAFATYAEQLVDGHPEPSEDLRIAGNVDRPTADYGTDERSYYAVTYGKGAAALEAARTAAGPTRFDAALRCFINANAWTIAEPVDLAAALSGLPAALAVLRRAGALT